MQRKRGVRLARALHTLAQPSPPMPVPTILIHASDTLIGALLGALLEGTAVQIVFAERGESTEDAMRRLRPRIVLADVPSLPLSASSTIDHETVLIGFGSANECARARASGHECFELPSQGEQLRRRVESFVEASV